MKWLVTGGAGYIGAHVVRALTNAGHQVVVIDNLSTGYAVRLPAGVPLVRADVGNSRALKGIFRKRDIDGVIHLAGLKSVAESVLYPMEYLQNNVTATGVLLAEMAAAGVRRLVFSSTAAVYADGARLPETWPLEPQSPYGVTKLWAEQLIQGAAELSFVVLRFFNVAGAATPQLSDRHGDNLLPRVFRSAMTGSPLSIRGAHHPTPDGTAIRDYIHVSDIASAHLAAVTSLRDVRGGATYNIGTGRGYSVQEIVTAVEQVTGLQVPTRIEPAMRGESACSIADAARIQRELGWSARLTLEDITSSMWSSLRVPSAIAV